MSKTNRDKTRYQSKQKGNPTFSYKLHFGLYFDSHPCTYKKMNRRLRRAKEKQALRECKEVPKFRKGDNHNYHNDW